MNNQNKMEKVQREHPDFCAEVDRMQKEEIKARTIALARHSKEIDDSQEADEELKAVREQLSEMSAPYRDAKKAVKAKLGYLVQLLEDKGGVPNGEA